jgi:hypothetical protein
LATVFDFVHEKDRSNDDAAALGNPAAFARGVELLEKISDDLGD